MSDSPATEPTIEDLQERVQELDDAVLAFVKVWRDLRFSQHEGTGSVGFVEDEFNELSNAVDDLTAVAPKDEA